MGHMAMIWHISDATAARRQIALPDGCSCNVMGHKRLGAERLVADVERVEEAIALDQSRWPDPSETDSTRHLQGACGVTR
jgi:hypothetical protein